MGSVGAANGLKLDCLNTSKGGIWLGRNVHGKAHITGDFAYETRRAGGGSMIHEDDDARLNVYNIRTDPVRLPVLLCIITINSVAQDGSWMWRQMRK